MQELAKQHPPPQHSLQKELHYRHHIHWEVRVKGSDKAEPPKCFFILPLTHFSFSSFLWSYTTCTSTLSSPFPLQALTRPNYLPGSNLGTELCRNEWVLILNWSGSSNIHTHRITGLTHGHLNFSILPEKVNLTTPSHLRCTEYTDAPHRPLSLDYESLLPISLPGD